MQTGSYEAVDGNLPLTAKLGTANGDEKLSAACTGQDIRLPVVFLVDARHICRDCFSEWLRAEIPHAEIYPFCNIDHAGDHAIARNIADPVVLYNIGAGSVLDPVIADGIRSFKARLPGAVTLVVSDNEGIEHVAGALQLDVEGYVPSNTATAVLVGAIQLVRVGGTFIPTDALKSLQRRGMQPRRAPPESEVNGFTPRQMQVLSCLRHGMSNKIIAYELDMSESTVKVHIRHIMKKLHATNRTQVVCMTNALFDATRSHHGIGA